MISSHAPKQSGFATTAALMMVSILSMALLLLSALLAADVRRTAHSGADAQLRQLLHAGAIDALAKSDSTSAPSDPWVIATPLKEDGSLRIEPVRSDRADRLQFRVLARIGDVKASQTITLAKSADRWNIESAELDP